MIRNGPLFDVIYHMPFYKQYGAKMVEKDQNL